MSTDLQNTRATLEGLQRDQDRLRAELELTGLTSFVDRSEWLLAHRTPDEKLADARRWARYEAEFLHPRAGEKHSDPAEATVYPLRMWCGPACRARVVGLACAVIACSR
jgi:hypothetical protein